jgi:hypothetical protein
MVHGTGDILRSKKIVLEYSFRITLCNENWMFNAAYWYRSLSQGRIVIKCNPFHVSHPFP